MLSDLYPVQRLPREILTREAFPFRVGVGCCFDLRGTLYLHPDGLDGLAHAARHCPVRLRLTPGSQPCEAILARFRFDVEPGLLLRKLPTHPDEWEIHWDPFAED
jgi:hypothetical protein